MGYCTLPLLIYRDHPIFFQLATSLLTLSFVRFSYGGFNSNLNHNYDFEYDRDDDEQQSLVAAASGTDEFYNLVTRNVYVDKSLFIEDFMRKGGLVCRILRPRGWGKTTNLRMLKRFFELEVDENGNGIARQNRTNRKLFEGGTIRVSPVTGRTKLLTRLRIADRSEIMDVQGEHPVIYLSLKRSSGCHYTEIEGRLRSLLVDLFEQYGYLQSYLTREDQETFFRHRYRLSSTSELADGVRFLSRILCQRYGQEVYILIDDYDAPIVNTFVALLRSARRQSRNKWEKQLIADVLESPELRCTVRLIENLIGRAVYRNDYLEQAIVSGTFEINLAHTEEGLRNDIRYSMLESVFAEYYGFSQAEVDELLDRRQSSLLSEEDYENRRQAIRHWYGYNVNGYVVYNPCSIEQFVSNAGRFQNYWNYTGKTPLADEILSTDGVQDDIQNLLDGRILYRNYSTELNFRSLTDNPNVLLFSGHLNVLRTGYMAEQLSIPNAEIRNIIEDKILLWLRRKLKIPAINFIAMFRRLSKLHVEDFAVKLRKHLTLIPPVDGTTTTSRQISTTYTNAIVKCLIRSFEKFYTVEIIDTRQRGGLTEGQTVLLTSQSYAVTSNSIILKYISIRDDDDDERRNGDFIEMAEDQLTEIVRELSKIKSKLPSYINETLALSLVFRQKNVALNYRKEAINVN